MRESYGKRMVKARYSVQQVEYLIRLVKQGDASSLKQLRQELGKTQEEIALEVGVSAPELGLWEQGEQRPSGIQHAHWKIKLSHYVDDVISDLLGIENTGVITRYWKLMWGLID
jgi:DNA-binding transcriptional regulator YiaG